MQDEHRTSGAPVTLRVDPGHAPFLRDHFESGIAGTLEQLAEAPGRLRDPFGSRAYAAAFARIIDGIEQGEITVDPGANAVLVEQAELNDEANEYERAAQEHEAFAHLLRQLNRQGKESGRPSGEGALDLQRALLLALLVPPAYGGFIGDLAGRIGESENLTEVEAAASELVAKGLATREGHFLAPAEVIVHLNDLLDLASAPPAVPNGRR